MRVVIRRTKQQLAHTVLAPRLPFVPSMNVDAVGELSQERLYVRDQTDGLERLPTRSASRPPRGSMSTQTIFTVAGTIFPTAIECNIVPIIRTSDTSRSFSRMMLLRLERVGR